MGKTHWDDIVLRIHNVHADSNPIRYYFETPQATIFGPTLSTTRPAR